MTPDQGKGYTAEGFCKEEHLCRKHFIDALFSEGKVIKRYPLRLVWVEGNASDIMPAQAMVGVSKKMFKRADKRNRIKRVLREAYRKHKMDLYTKLEEENKKISLAVFYLSKEMPDSRKVDEDMKSLLGKLIDRI